MPENQKDKKDGTVEEDQKDRGYYYDDSHGYEEFDPEEDNDDAEIEDAGTGQDATRGQRDAEIDRRGDAAVKP